MKLTKENIYVEVSGKKEARWFKGTLKALGEPIYKLFMPQMDNQKYLIFEEDLWLIGNKAFGKIQVTFRHALDIILSESKPAEKIAVRVDNEKEFKALMNYYDSLGWKWEGGNNPLDYEGKIYFPNLVVYKDNFISISGTPKYENYKTIPFSDFAKEHGIRVPLLISEDGVELFDGDDYHRAYYYFDCEGSIHNGWKYNLCYGLKPVHSVLTDSETSKAFSTKQAALDWIEAQKPKVKVVNLDNNLCFIITKSEIKIDYQLKGGNAISITNEQLKEAYKAMEELNS